MKRIDGAGHVNGRFVAEDAAISRPPTEITADWLNMVQEEICNAITGAGMALNPAATNQLYTAILAYINSAIAGSVGGVIDADTVGGYSPARIWKDDGVMFNVAGGIWFPPDASGKRWMVQWGDLPAVGGSVDVAFPAPFPNGCVHVGPSVDSDTDGAADFRVFTRNRTRAGFQLFTGGFTMRGGTYLAIGY